MNRSVTYEIEKIFNTFNKLYFDDLLPPPMITYNNSLYGSLNKNAVTKNGSCYSYELILPINILNKDIDEIAACVLHNMIHEYDYIYEKKMASRGDTYHNKRFKNFAEKCGLTCECSSEKYGWTTHTNDEFKTMCIELGFDKNWSNRYELPQSVKQSSTVKYIDEISGESVRGTKPNHILFCFNDCPDLAIEIERIYGKKRMVVCD